MTPEELLARLNEIQEAAVSAAEAAEDSDSARDVATIYLGRRSDYSQLKKQLRDLPDEARKQVGERANEVKDAIEGAIAKRIELLQAGEESARLEAERLDVTLPGRRSEAGVFHPLLQVMDEIVDVFVGLGFQVVEGPEVETDYYNFEALNLPKDHAARSMHDSFYLESPNGEQSLFRTHTSPMQVRVMESQPPPVYVVVPGRCARRDAPDPRRMPVFYQVEGLAVDDGISFADLKGTLEAFAKAMFGQDQRVRFAPSYFPFTEPSAEVSVLCFVCGGTGCKTCTGEGWLELLGAGMVHPNVFKAVGYDPDVTGFAFGMGIERVAMTRYSIPDIRWLYENDVRFLRSFR
jgi:phenylalanyl-tRNA synthetase alpha chain